MAQADWKLRLFYQYQLAKIAKLAREQTHPASRKRLNFLLNQYIDMLLVMPKANHAARSAGYHGVASRPGAFRRSARSGEAGSCAGRPGTDVVNLHPRRESGRRISRTGSAAADRQVCQQEQ
jgi:hypothetical protein